MGSYAIPNPDTIDWTRKAKDDAWSDFVTDYVGCVDDDPGDARARYLAAVAAIDAINAGVADGEATDA